MSINLDFSGHNTRYATHGLHSYAAKCPPQLVEFGLSSYSMPGDLVLDPMTGSGTTLVEAKLHGRNSLGFDIDPLACLIARVKSTVVDHELAGQMAKEVVKKVQEDLDILRSGIITDDLFIKTTSPDFPNRDYWFTKKVQQELSLLSYHIQHLQCDESIREFLWVAFSGTILTKVSVANARDIIHSRHHYFGHPVDPDVLAKFEKRVHKMQKQMKEFSDICVSNNAMASVRMGDARSLPIADSSVDMVFTSPPYATALDYPRAHFLAVNWMQKPLETSHDQYKKRGETYIGSERGKIQEQRTDAKLTQMAHSVVSQLAEVDRRKSLLLERYFSDMALVFHEINRVLKPEKYAIIVVCPSHIRKIEVPTHKVFTEFAQFLDLKLVDEHTRTIDSGKRLLPHVRGGFGNRMSTEYVLIYKKGD